VKTKTVILSTLLILVLISGIGSLAAFAGNKEDNSRLIPAISFSVDNNEIGFRQDRDLHRGAQSFDVVDGVVYILDTQGKKVIVTDENGTKYYSLFNVRYPKDILVKDENVYILDAWVTEGSIIRYDLAFNEIERCDFKVNTDMYSHLEMFDGKVALTSNYTGIQFILENNSLIASKDGGDVVAAEDGFVNVYHNGKNYRVSRASNDFINFLAESNNELVYSRTKVVNNCSILTGEITIEKCNTEGRFVAGIALTKNEDHAWPNKYVDVDGDKIYYMECTKEKTTIYEIYFGSTFVSNFKEIEKKALEEDALFMQQRDALQQQ
jgi:hypothetical protein